MQPMKPPYKITWERASTGWKEPRLNGEPVNDSFAWVHFAELCNALRAELDRVKGDLAAGAHLVATVGDKNRELEMAVGMLQSQRNGLRAALQLAEVHIGFGDGSSRNVLTKIRKALAACEGKETPC